MAAGDADDRRSAAGRRRCHDGGSRRDLLARDRDRDRARPWRGDCHRTSARSSNASRPSPRRPTRRDVDASPGERGRRHHRRPAAAVRRGIAASLAATGPSVPPRHVAASGGRADGRRCVRRASGPGCRPTASSRTSSTRSPTTMRRAPPPGHVAPCPRRPGRRPARRLRHQLRPDVHDVSARAGSRPCRSATAMGSPAPTPTGRRRSFAGGASRSSAT